LLVEVFVVDEPLEDGVVFPTAVDPGSVDVDGEVTLKAAVAVVSAADVPDVEVPILVIDPDVPTSSVPLLMFGCVVETTPDVPAPEAGFDDGESTFVVIDDAKVGATVVKIEDRKSVVNADVMPLVPRAEVRSDDSTVVDDVMGKVVVVVDKLSLSVVADGVVASAAAIVVTLVVIGVAVRMVVVVAITVEPVVLEDAIEVVEDG
jgi:hypothetical protein